ncbi:MAG TPA: hypothetical protein VNP98_17350 [Chthoniobacterales bacterium]|nr:hypothetical protein [Chthoniobacterales bacterium]
MKINDQHLLEGANARLLPGGSAPNARRLLVIHFLCRSDRELAAFSKRILAAIGPMARLRAELKLT